MKLDKTRLGNSRGYLEGGPDAVDEETSALAANYKKEVCKNYISISPEQIDTRLGGSDFYVTRKYDGEFSVLFWTGTELFTLNTGLKVRMGIPCMEEAARLLQKAGIKEAVIPAELHATEDGGRRRVFDVLEALADRSRLDKLRLAPFDIISLDGAPFKASSYGDIHRKLSELFPEAGGLCVPVRCDTADSRAGVKELFRAWVEEEGAEGLVIHSESPRIYKVKPRYTLDVAVLGFSEGAGEYKGQIRSLLLAMMSEEGVYQIVGHAGNGFTEELKKELYPRFLAMKMPSKYIETDSNHVAFHMIRPELVIELKVTDILFETASGPIYNPRLEILNGEYRGAGSVPGISLVFPIFERFREDKQVNPQDVRFSQAGELIYNYAEEKTESPGAGKSEILARKVYRKEQAGKLMVQKYLVWKTNKEKQNYPAYVFSYTNFSSDRAEPLSVETRISDSPEQIMEFCRIFMDKNIKKGWEKVT